MKVSTSILSVNEQINESLTKLNNTSTDYLHLDVMDGKFVIKDTTAMMDEVLKYNKKPLDIHLMAYDINYFIDKYKSYNPEFITFHIEASLDNTKEIIDTLKKNNIKVGISFKPDTDLNLIYPYLSDIDLVLVMSVEPGQGGQSFIPSSTDKINLLKQIREDNNYHYLIEVDGGINSNTIDQVSGADIVVSGSYITSGNYEENICKLKGN